jgi:hypothetical protein
LRAVREEHPDLTANGGIMQAQIKFLCHLAAAFFYLHHGLPIVSLLYAVLGLVELSECRRMRRYLKLHHGGKQNAMGLKAEKEQKSK